MSYLLRIFSEMTSAVSVWDAVKATAALQSLPFDENIGLMSCFPLRRHASISFFASLGTQGEAYRVSTVHWEMPLVTYLRGTSTAVREDVTFDSPIDIYKKPLISIR